MSEFVGDLVATLKTYMECTEEAFYYWWEGTDFADHADLMPFEAAEHGFIAGVEWARSHPAQESVTARTEDAVDPSDGSEGTRSTRV